MHHQCTLIVYQVVGMLPCDAIACRFKNFHINIQVMPWRKHRRHSSGLSAWPLQWCIDAWVTDGMMQVALHGHVRASPANQKHVQGNGCWHGMDAQSLHKSIPTAYMHGVLGESTLCPCSDQENAAQDIPFSHKPINSDKTDLGACTAWKMDGKK